MAWYGMAWHGMEHSIAWHGMAWHGMGLWWEYALLCKVLFVFDHGYGGGTHILPNGVAVYCAWNTDNGHSIA